MVKDDGTPLRLEELVVGGDIRMLGQEFFITDADEFTRQYFRYVLVSYSILSLQLSDVHLTAL